MQTTTVVVSTSLLELFVRTILTCFSKRSRLLFIVFAAESHVRHDHIQKFRLRNENVVSLREEGRSEYFVNETTEHII